MLSQNKRWEQQLYYPQTQRMLFWLWLGFYGFKGKNSIGIIFSNQLNLKILRDQLKYTITPLCCLNQKFD